MTLGRLRMRGQHLTLAKQAFFNCQALRMRFLQQPELLALVHKQVFQCSLQQSWSLWGGLYTKN